LSAKAKANANEYRVCIAKVYIMNLKLGPLSVLTPYEDNYAEKKRTSKFISHIYSYFRQFY